MVKPDGTSNAGSEDAPLSSNEHISAMATVERSASGWSGKMRAISLAGLQVELVGVEAQPLGVRDLLARADAEQDVVRVVVVLAQVVGVVGGDERQAGLAVACGPGPG